MKNILIIKTGALGDVLRSSVILYGLKDKYPVSRVFWVTSKAAIPLLQNHPLIDHIEANGPISKELAGYKFDLIINLEENPDVFNKYRTLKCKRGNWMGPYTISRQVTYTDNFRPIYDMSLISRFPKIKADAIKKLNGKSYPELLYECLGLKWEKQKYRLYGIHDKTLPLIRRNPVIGIVIGAGVRWPMKALPDDLTIKLIRLIQEWYRKDITLVIIPGVDDNYRALDMVSLCHKRPEILVKNPGSMEDLFKAVNECDVIITPDTLPMHVAIALDKYVIAYFTVTSTAEVEIYNGHKITPDDFQQYCSYSTKYLPRPNITDLVDLEEILYFLMEALKEKSI